MRVHRVSDFEDPRLEGYAKIRERDLIGRERKFIAEGEVVLKVLVTEQPAAIESIAITDRRIDRIASLVEHLDIDLFALPDSVMESLTGIDLHRGILALARRFEAVTPDACLDAAESAIAVGIFGVSNHDNVGGIFRNAAAFGAQAILLDQASCDPFYRKAIRVSVGGVFKVPFFRGKTSTTLLDDFESAGYEPLALSPTGKESLASAALSRRTALILGAEGPGLDGSVLSRARSVRIDMAPGFDSLNVAATSAIALHRLFELQRSQ